MNEPSQAATVNLRLDETGQFLLTAEGAPVYVFIPHQSLSAGEFIPWGNEWDLAPLKPVKKSVWHGLGRWIQQWQPLIGTSGSEDPRIHGTDLTPSKERAPKKSGEAPEMQATYRNWQLYVYAGPQADDIQQVTGLWERASVNLQPLEQVDPVVDPVKPAAGP
ncbi:hypothetical protein [Deinococcus misasensis]|uniref:hypothetical protein n=1 Tax=Deinococcus misasensis TaxID=392413 RepID=UPI00055617A4|nr:hypothetical protein [Deinococcus misasensis]